MKVLLDTHAVVWAAEGDSRLGRAAKALLNSLVAGDAVISDISLLEIAMLVDKGRVVLACPLVRYLRDLRTHFPVLAIGPEIAADSVALRLPQGDPFDRVIAATARHHELPLITRDTHLTSCRELRTVWD